MKNEEIVRALRRLKVETGSLVCMGCGREHNCGPIGLLENGDIIEVELAQNRIHACVTDEEFVRRKESWQPHAQPGVTNLLARYARNVGSSRTGAVIK